MAHVLQSVRWDGMTGPQPGLDSEPLPPPGAISFAEEGIDPRARLRAVPVAVSKARAWLEAV